MPHPLLRVLLPDRRWNDTDFKFKSFVPDITSLSASAHTKPIFSPSTRSQELLKKNAPLSSKIDPKLGRVIAAVLENSGSLFRAELTLATAEACGLEEAHAESLASGLEYFHVASLLFDDLPFMDDSSLRRGAICVHLLYGEGLTTLAALAFITRAYALIGVAVAAAPASRQAPALALVERCLGTTGMLNGQARDLHFPAGNCEAREVIAVALAKTVPLIQLALLLPALLAGLGPVEQRILRRLSVCWGLFYQGVDDLKDLLGSTEVHGKSAHQDQRLGRPNVAHQFGLNRTGDYLRRLARIAHRCCVTLAAMNARFACLQPMQQLLVSRWQQLPGISQ